MKIGKRAFALATTLMIMALLVALTTAFMAINQAASRLTGNSLERRTAQDACQTALHLAWTEIENRRDWGRRDTWSVSGWQSFPVGHPIVQVSREFDVAGWPVYRGIMQTEGDFNSPDAVHFEMHIYNNLTDNSVSVPQTRAKRAQVMNNIPVPARACRLICEARCGTSSRTMDTILRQVPLSYDSLAAGRAASVGLNAGGILRLESRDPYLNRISAGTNLALPAAPDVQFLKHGTASSHDQLNVASLNLASPATTDAQIRNANQQSGGVYQPHATPPTTPSFVKDNFKLPGNITEVPAGSYVFGGIERTEYHPHHIDYDEFIPDPLGGPGHHDSGHVERHQKVTMVYDQLVDAQGRIWVSAMARTGSTNYDPPTVPSAPFDSAAAASAWGYSAMAPSWAGGATPEPELSDVHEIYPGLFANVVTGQMAVRSGVRVHSPGAFLVVGGTRAPEMLFGYSFSSGGVATEESLRDGLEAAQDDPAKYMAALEAGGNVDIPGGVLGYGSMIAGGDMTLKASSGLRAAPELGVVVKARSLTINPATEPEPGLPGEPVSLDYPTFREAITNFAGGDWTPFDNWLSDTAASRNTLVQNMRTTRLALPASSYWSQLNTELHASFPMPTLVGDWGGNATIEQYVRLKEFIQTLSSGYNHGLGDDTWLDMAQHQDDAAARLENMVSDMAQWAKSYKKTLQAYLASPQPEVPEMFYQGLLYADQDLTVNASGKAFRLEGSAVARGDANINGARNVDLVYDRNIVDQQLESNLMAPHVKLEKIFFSIR